MKKIILLFIAFSLASCSSMHGSAQTNDNKKWLGTYEYEDCAKGSKRETTPCLNYKLRITDQGDGLIADLDVDGFQTMSRIKGKAVARGDKLDLNFSAYRKGNIGDAYKPGDRLFSLKRSDGKIITNWQKMKPSFTKKDKGQFFAKKNSPNPHAGQSQQSPYCGKYGFDWSNPHTSKCILISRDNPKGFAKSYECKKSDLKGSSGVSILAECKAKKGISSYLIFKTKDDCMNEKQNQEAAE